mgnify:CR=1 FL=1
MTKLAKDYKPRDYNDIEYKYKPLGMRILEKQMQQPFIEVVQLLYNEHKVMTKVADKLGLSQMTLRVWVDKVGLNICTGCSKDKGILYTSTVKCSHCRQVYLCAACEVKHPDSHFPENF